MPQTYAGIGTQMRAALADLGVADYRPHFTPIVRALTALGPLPIRDLARLTSVSDAELPYPLRDLIPALLKAPERRPFYERVVDHLTGTAAR